MLKDFNQFENNLETLVQDIGMQEKRKKKAQFSDSHSTKIWQWIQYLGPVKVKCIWST